MSPLDDELRAALRGRAATVTPAPDPLAGIERRATRMRRTRAASAVAASALAVAAIAVAVPALSPSAAPAPLPPATTTSEPSPQVSPVPSPDSVAPPTSYALDPRDPWVARGVPVDEGTRATIQAEYATRAQGAEVLVTPLFAQVYEPSGQLEVVFLAEVDGGYRWGVAQSSESGPEFTWDAELSTRTTALAAALPGDEVARLLVVAAPGTDVEYGPDDASEFADASELADGVATAALEGDAATDQYRVLGPEGELARAAAPDPAGGTDEPVDAAAPDNLLAWSSRGARSEGPSDEQVLLAFSQGLSGTVDPATTSYRPLFSGSTDAGVRFTYGQAWAAGQPAHAVGLATGGTQGDQLFLGPVTPDDVTVLAFLLCCEPGSSVETLVVVPAPGTGQVQYDDDATGEFRAVGQSQDALDGVVLIDRDPRAQSDRLQLLDGNGDLDRPIFEGPVFNLLCALTECG